MHADVQTTDQIGSTSAIVNRFNDLFNRHDVDGIMACMTDDCVFESTNPPPDGGRFEGQEAVRECWKDLFRASPDALFEAEEMVVAGDRCCVRWIYRYTSSDGQAHHLRGIDLFRVRDGKVAEKLAYVKG